MRALILAAGRGSRMGDLTDARPKCLCEVGGRTLLSMQIDALRGAGVEQIGIVTGYKADAFDGLGLETFHNARWQETNMVASLRTGSSWLASAPCIVSYADIFYSLESVKRLATATADIAISYDPDWLRLWEARFQDPLSDAETFRIDDQSRLLEIGGKARNTEQIQGQYVGLLKFEPTGWNTTEQALSQLTAHRQDKIDMTSALAALIELGVTIEAVKISGDWGEVDSEADINTYETMIKDGLLSP